MQVSRLGELVRLIRDEKKHYIRFAGVYTGDEMYLQDRKYMDLAHKVAAKFGGAVFNRSVFGFSDCTVRINVYLAPEYLEQARDEFASLEPLVLEIEHPGPKRWSLDFQNYAAMHNVGPLANYKGQWYE